MSHAKKIVLGQTEKRVVTFRGNAETANQVKELAKKLGLSTCHVYDGLGKAFVKGTSFIVSRKNQKEQKSYCIQLPWICNTTNVTVVREVLHRRRLKREYACGDPEFSYNNFDMGKCEGPAVTRAEVMEDF